VTLRDVVALYPGADSAFSGKQTFVVSNGRDSHLGSDATNVTSFKGSSLGYQAFGSDWTVTNFKEAVSPAALYRAPGESLYNTTQGAQIRYRYVNGQLTNQELWPWPMSQRIKDATTQASRDGHGHQIENIDAYIQDTFGTFPSTAARTPTSTPAPANTPAQTPPPTSTPASTASTLSGRSRRTD
jgi:hypothetical protein